MSGREFDVMDFDAPDEPRTTSPWGSGPGRGWGTYGLVLVVISALVVGGVIGVRWGEHRESSRRQAAADSTLSLSAAVVPGSTAHAPVPDIATVSQQVDVALINSGPGLLSDVAIVWDPVHQAYSQGTEGKVTLSNLPPAEPQQVTLSLRQPCTTPALQGVGDVPRLVVRARTPDGRPRTVTLDPLGMDATWAAMRAACPVNDNPVLATSVNVTGSEELGQNGARLTLTFDNPASVDVLVTDVSIVRGVDTSRAQRPAKLQVFPHFSAQAKLDLVITNCKAAMLDSSPVDITYTATSMDDPGHPQPVTQGNPSVSEAVSKLLYRACSRP